MRMRTLAQAVLAATKERLGDAEALLRRATELAPDLRRGLDRCSGALLHEHGAPGGSDRLLSARRRSSSPANAGRWSGLGDGYAHIGDVHEKHQRLTRGRSRCSPDVAGIHMSYGHALKTLGEQAGACGEYRAAIALKPEFGEVYWSMANLKVFRFERRRGRRDGSSS